MIPKLTNHEMKESFSKSLFAVRTKPTYGVTLDLD